MPLLSVIVARLMPAIAFRVPILVRMVVLSVLMSYALYRYTSREACSRPRRQRSTDLITELVMDTVMFPQAIDLVRWYCHRIVGHLHDSQHRLVRG